MHKLSQAQGFGGACYGGLSDLGVYARGIPDPIWLCTYDAETCLGCGPVDPKGTSPKTYCGSAPGAG